MDNVWAKYIFYQGCRIGAIKPPLFSGVRTFASVQLLVEP